MATSSAAPASESWSTDTEHPGSSKATGVVIPPEISVLARLLLYRLNNNMEAQILITGKSAVRGLGKTQLAICLAKWIHRCVICGRCGFIWPYTDPQCPRCESDEPSWRAMPSWSYEENAFLRVNRYIEACLGTSREVMVFDEIEYAADSRRAMTHENVDLSQALMTLRIQNNVMIATLPTASVLDGRIEKLADIWINVVRRGDAHGYHLWTNDFPPYQRSRIRMALENGWIESIHWNAIDDDPDYQKLSEDKKRLMRSSGDELNEEMQEALKSHLRETKIEILENLLATTEVSQRSLASAFDVAQGWVSQINNGYLDIQEETADRYPIRA